MLLQFGSTLWTRMATELHTAVLSRCIVAHNVFIPRSVHTTIFSNLHGFHPSMDILHLRYFKGSYRIVCLYRTILMAI